MLANIKYATITLLMTGSIFLQAQRIDSLVFVEGITIFFDSAKDQLTTDNKTSIDSFLIDKKTNSLFRIEGHTDDVGSEAYNNALAARRTESVFQHLAKKEKIDTNKIFYNSYGELKPAKSNINNDSRKFNRRVDLSNYTQQAMRRIKGNVRLDSMDNSTIAKIRVEGKNFKDSTYSQQDGDWSIVVPDSVFIKLDISAPNYFFSTKRIKVSKALDSRKIELALPQLSVGKVYNMPDFYFKPNSPILLESSEPTLALLYMTMADSDVCIHIKGHVNYPNEPNVPKTHQYYKLSVSRSKTVYDFLTSKGIKENRMKHNGYGNWEMVYPKATKESLMKKNRRVEIEIIECNL